MRLRRCQCKLPRAAEGAFSLVEVTFGMALAAILLTALYTGLTYGFSVMRLARENTRATQILVEKMETVRLYNWDQINTPECLPSTFEVAYYPMGGVTNPGTIYHGTLTISDTALTAGYASDMKKITVTLNWKTGGLPRTRTLSTYVSRYGMQNYIYF
jgi:type II secretory pathway pseudopilin PulG